MLASSPINFETLVQFDAIVVCFGVYFTQINSMIKRH